MLSIFHFARVIITCNSLKFGWKYKEDYFGFENQTLQTSLFAERNNQTENGRPAAKQGTQILAKLFPNRSENFRLIVREQRNNAVNSLFSDSNHHSPSVTAGQRVGTWHTTTHGEYANSWLIPTFILRAWPMCSSSNSACRQTSQHKGVPRGDMFEMCSAVHPDSEAYII